LVEKFQQEISKKKIFFFFRYPDTFLYNTADNAGFLLPHDSQNVIVSYNGTIFWPLPLAQLRTRCRMTIKHFPFGRYIIYLDKIFGKIA
jgi:hypothetical protein